MVSIYKLDLHTHSQASPDGSLTMDDYRAMLDNGGLDYIAITDHDCVDFALAARAELGSAIVVGEEITTREGELIGLFLTGAIEPGLSLERTIERIHQQGGLVYVPHPFERVRHGLSAAALAPVAARLDIMEAYNGRAVVQNKSPAAKAWATQHQLAAAASSDAHGRQGWGKTFTAISEPPTANNLVKLLRQAQLAEQSVGARGVLYPKLNRLRKRLAHD